MSSQTFYIVQIVLAVILIILVLLQVKGTGLGTTFGDLGFYQTRRGVEKLLFYITIITVSLFLAASLIRLVM